MLTDVLRRWTVISVIGAQLSLSRIVSYRISLRQRLRSAQRMRRPLDDESIDGDDVR